MNWARHCDSGLAIRGEGQSLADPDNTYRCKKCEDVVFSDQVTDHLVSLGTCDADLCVEARIRDLNREEECLKRIAAIISQPQTDVNALEQEFKLVRGWRAFNGLLEGKRG